VLECETLMRVCMSLSKKMEMNGSGGMKYELDKYQNTSYLHMDGH